ncbi:MAG: hypothetical protein R3D71_10220 [Rickettsiales bacterium]
MSTTYQLIFHVTDNGGFPNVGHTFVELKAINDGSSSSVYRGKWPEDHGIGSLYSDESIHDEAAFTQHIDNQGYEHVQSIPIELTEAQYIAAMDEAHGYAIIPPKGLVDDRENYVFLAHNCVDFAQDVLEATGIGGTILDYFSDGAIGLDTPVEIYMRLSFGTTVITDVKEFFIQLTSSSDTNGIHLFNGIEGLANEISFDFDGSVNAYLESRFGANKITDTNTISISGTNVFKISDAIGGTFTNLDGIDILEDYNSGYAISLVDDNKIINVANDSYYFNEVIDSVENLATSTANFISTQVDEATQWFTNGEGAQLIFAQWLGANMQNLVDGNLSADDAFISLAQFFGERILADQIGNIVTVNDASAVIQDSLQELGVDAGLVETLSGDLATALSRMAVDFALHSDGWNSQQYINAGITTISGVVAARYAKEIFPNSVTDANATVAAITTAVSGLLNSNGFDSGDWLNLGAQVGIAAGSVIAGDAIATAIIGSSAAGGPVAIVAAAVVALVAGKILGSLFGSKKFYDGEFGDPNLVLNSIYQVQQIDDGNGGTIPALVAVNANGSTIVSQGITTILGNTGQDVLVGTDADDSIFSGSGSDYLEGKAGNDTLVGDVGSDHISGGDGDDFISGGADDDVIFGDGGNDTIVSDDGDDRFVVNKGEGLDTITDPEAGDRVSANDNYIGLNIYAKLG